MEVEEEEELTSPPAGITANVEHWVEAGERPACPSGGTVGSAADLVGGRGCDCTDKGDVPGLAHGERLREH